MFNNLLESKQKKEKRGGGTVTSVVVHSILVGLAVYATANAAIRNEKPKQEKIDFVETPKDEPPPPKEEPPPPTPPDIVVAPPPPKGFQVLTAPVEIPDVIPDIDLSKKVTDEADFSGMAAGPPLCIGQIAHQAFMRVDEDGTKAAAATAVASAAARSPARTVRVFMCASWPSG